MSDENNENLPAPKQDFVMYCVEKMQTIPEKLPEKIRNMMMETIGQRMESYLDQEEATALSKSNLLPKDYKENPANIMLAFKTGRSIGLDRLQSLQHTFTVNGRTRVYGDMMLALSMKHRDFVDIKFEYGPDVIVDKAHGSLPEYVKCIVVLKERENVESLYTLEDAKKNPNFNNSHTPWMNGHGRRMMKFRSQSFSLRDAFPDKLSGVYDEYEFEEIQTVSKNINAETTDLGNKSASDNLKDTLKEESKDEEATEPENVEIQDKDGNTIKTDKKKKPEEAPQGKPENIEEIKADFNLWKKGKHIKAKEYKAYYDAGSSGKWDEVIQMHKKFKENIIVDPVLGENAKRLSEIVDHKDYNKTINDLAGDKNVELITPKNAGEVLRTTDEKLASQILELIEIRKDQIDSAEKETELDGPH